MKYAVVAAMIAAAVVVVIEHRDTRVLAGHIGMTLYPSGGAMVQVPYRRDGDAGTATITIGAQTVVRVMPANPVKYGNDNYFFRPSAAFNERVRISISYESGSTAQTVDKMVKVIHARADDPTNVGISDETAPSTAAEAVVSLAKAHSADDKLPAYPSTIIQELKNDMRWSAETDVTPENFVSGLNLWATKKGLPIHTEKIIGTSVRMLDAFSQTLGIGGTAQVYIQFKRAGRVMGGHMVSVVRVARIGDDIFIGIRDSVGPAGTDVYRVRDGAFIDYAFSDDTAVIGWGFVQIWNK